MLDLHAMCRGTMRAVDAMADDWEASRALAANAARVVPAKLPTAATPAAVASTPVPQAPTRDVSCSSFGDSSAVADTPPVANGRQAGADLEMVA